MSSVCFLLLMMLMMSTCAIPVQQSALKDSQLHSTTAPKVYDILHELGEYFKGRDIMKRQLAEHTGPVTMAKNDILHELGEYWKGRLAALFNHGIQHVHHISQLLSNLK